MLKKIILIGILGSLSLTQVAQAQSGAISTRDSNAITVDEKIKNSVNSGAFLKSDNEKPEIKKYQGPSTKIKGDLSKGILNPELGSVITVVAPMCRQAANAPLCLETPRPAAIRGMFIYPIKGLKESYGIKVDQGELFVLANKVEGVGLKSNTPSFGLLKGALDTRFGFSKGIQDNTPYGKIGAWAGKNNIDFIDVLEKSRVFGGSHVLLQSKGFRGMIQSYNQERGEGAFYATR